MTFIERTTLIKPKLIFWVILLIFVAGSVFIAWAVKKESQKPISDKNIASISESIASMTYNDKKLYLMFDKTMTAEQFYSIKDVLSSLGVSDIQSIQRDNTLIDLCCKDCQNQVEGDVEVYKVLTPTINNIIFCLRDNVMHCVNYMGKTLYENGEAKAKLSDFALSDHEITQFQSDAKKAIEKFVLKAPLKPSYPEMIRWNIYKEGKTYVVSSHVDVMNIDTFVKQSSFTVVFANDASLSSLTFDGQKIKIK